MTAANLLEPAARIRSVALDLCYRNRASHLGGAFSVADILVVLYHGGVLRFDPRKPDWMDRDRFFYSKGHACTALYAVLEDVGFTKGLEESFTQNGSYWTSHVNHKIPGVELSTGSLGHAFPVAAGTALAGRLRQREWLTYCVVSDGELDEGSNWEASLFASHNRLKNLCLIVDCNKIQSFGTTSEVCSLEPLDRKFDAFGWEVRRIDGHNHQELLDVFLEFKTQGHERPFVVIADTIKGKGVSFMEGQLAWHYKSPNQEEYVRALEQLRVQ